MKSLKAPLEKQIGQRLETVSPVLLDDSNDEQALNRVEVNARSIPQKRHPRKNRRGNFEAPKNRFRIDDSSIDIEPGGWIRRILSGWMFSLIMHCLLLIWLGCLVANAPKDGSLTLEVSFEESLADDSLSIEIAPMEIMDDFEELAGGAPLAPVFNDEQTVQDLEDPIKPILDASLTVPEISESFLDTAADDDMFEPVNLGLAGIDEGDEGSGNGQGKEKGDGKSSKVKFFGLESSGNRFVFVVDSSGSMGDEQRYQRAVYELTRSMDMLETGHLFLVILYNTETTPMLGMTPQNIRMIPATRANKNLVLAWLKEQTPQSQTMPMVAMKTSLLLKPSSIFFLSDGEFHDQTIPMLDELNVANSSTGAQKIPINTITLGSTGFGAPLMKYIADESGGRFRWVQ